MDERILQKLEDIRDLPTIPLVIQKIEEVIQDPNASAKQVAEVIEDDPAIMARVLKMVNSVFYRGRESREITSLPLAIARMGFHTIRNIALTTSIFSAFSNRKVRLFNHDQFWVHCIATGIINNIVYETCGGNLKHIYTRDELHLLGLLHDIGKIILEQYLNSEFEQIIEYGRANQLHIVDAEEAVLGVNHAQIGAWLAKKWNLPLLYVTGILFHHKTTSAPEEFMDAVIITNISDYICLKGRFGYSGTDILPTFESKVWKYLGLDNKSLAEILDRAGEEANESALMLTILNV